MTRPIGRCLAVTGVLVASLFAATADAHAGGIVTRTFNTQGETAFVVPNGVTQMHVVATGAGGDSSLGGSGASGATVTADIPSTPGSTLYVEVNVGGGSGGSAGQGGGASDVRTCSTTATNCGDLGTPDDPRLLVAGGGGEAGYAGGGGNGGAAGITTLPCATASDGTTGNGGTFGTGGGCASGGTGGTALAGGTTGADGVAGAGGAGDPTGNGGGGGGGGYYGGGGGGASGPANGSGGGGGGGSSFVSASATDAAIVVATSGPSVVITYPSTAPGAPTNVFARAGNHRARVSWHPPASDGGDPIIDYTVTSDPSGVTATVAAPATTATVTGLRNGVLYRFTVVARNDVGTGPSSVPSGPVRPHRRR